MRPLDGYKRYFDIGILIASHVLLAPVFLALWLVIPLLIFLIDGRPILFFQERVGRDGQSFKVYKFRTMVKDASLRGPAYTTENDPRVLPLIGRFLRSTGLDELPQLINILKGDSSFVGPRPLPVPTHRECVRTIPGFQEREKLLPGLTGLSQLYAGRLSWDEWLAYDLEYARKMSPWLDLRILVLSILTTLAARWDGSSRRVVIRGTTRKPPALTSPNLEQRISRNLGHIGVTGVSTEARMKQRMREMRTVDGQ